MKTAILCFLGTTCIAGGAFPQAVGMVHGEPQITTASPNLAAPTEPIAGLVPIHTGTDEPEAPYGIWGGAIPHYKASFHGDMTFVPYLGKDYPTNQPVSWHTMSVTVGNEVLVGATDEPTRQWTDHRFEYRFGRVTEAYDLRQDGLEQTFTVHRRPAAAGDLVVTGRLGTALIAETCQAEHRGIVLRDQNGREITRYGEAYAVDATGETLPIATTCDGERLTLTVPKAFVDRAVFPLVIDPLLRRQTPVGNFDPVEQVDICRDDSANDLMIAFTLAVSAADYDAYAYITRDDFSGGTVAFSDAGTNFHITRIRCATADNPAKYCIVLTRGINWANQNRIRYQVRASGDLTHSSAVRQDIITPANSQYWRPDVGGTTLNGNGDHFLLVWQKDDDPNMGGNTPTSEIRAVPVDVTGVTGVGGGVLGTEVRVRPGATAADAEYPSVNQEASAVAGAGTTWVVCWQEFAPSDSDWDIVVRQVNASSNVSNTRYGTGGTPRQKLGPQIAGSSGRYAIVYSAGTTALMPGKVSGIGGSTIDLVRLDWPNGSATTAAHNPIVTMTPMPDRRWTVGGIAFDDQTRSHWAFFHRSAFSGVLYTGRVGHNGDVLEGPQLVVDQSIGTNVLGGITFDDDADRWALAWGAPSYAIRGNHLVYPTGAAPTTSGPACSSATISWFGGGQNQQIGCEFSGVRLSGMPSGAFSAVAIGFRSRSVPLPRPLFGAGCWQNIELFAPTDLGIGSDVSFRLPLPEFLRAGTIYFQGFHTNATGNEILSTERLIVPIIR